MTSQYLGSLPQQEEGFYDFIGRVSLRLVAYNADAITTMTFLREIAEAGGPGLSLEQARNIARNYLNCEEINA